MKRFIIFSALIALGSTALGQVGNFNELKVKSKISLGDRAINKLYNDSTFAAADSLSLPTSWAVKGYVESKIGSFSDSQYYKKPQVDSIIDKVAVRDVTWSVLNILQNPPASPKQNDRYLVGTLPAAEFLGKANNIATYDSTAGWVFAAPSLNDIVFNAANLGAYKFNGTSWVTRPPLPVNNWWRSSYPGYGGGVFGARDANGRPFLLSNGVNTFGWGSQVFEGSKRMGSDNIAIGQVSQHHNHGDRNISMGNYSLWYSVTGHDQVAIGHRAMGTGNKTYSIGLGTNARNENRTFSISDSTNQLYMKLATATGNPIYVIGRDNSGNWKSYPYSGLDGGNGTYIPLTEKGANNGVATLDNSGKVPSSQLPALVVNQPSYVQTRAQMLALSAVVGDIVVLGDSSKSYALMSLPANTFSNWLEIKSPVPTNTDLLPEGVANIYFTNARARSAISGENYNPATGVITTPKPDWEAPDDILNKPNIPAEFTPVGKSNIKIEGTYPVLEFSTENVYDVVQTDSIASRLRSEIQVAAGGGVTLHQVDSAASLKHPLEDQRLSTTSGVEFGSSTVGAVHFKVRRSSTPKKITLRTVDGDYWHESDPDKVLFLPMSVTIDTLMTRNHSRAQLESRISQIPLPPEDELVKTSGITYFGTNAYSGRGAFVAGKNRDIGGTTVYGARALNEYRAGYSSENGKSADMSFFGYRAGSEVRYGANSIGMGNEAAIARSILRNSVVLGAAAYSRLIPGPDGFTIPPYDATDSTFGVTIIGTDAGQNTKMQNSILLGNAGGTFTKNGDNVLIIGNYTGNPISGRDSLTNTTILGNHIFSDRDSVVAIGARGQNVIIGHDTLTNDWWGVSRATYTKDNGAKLQVNGDVSAISFKGSAQHLTGFKTVGGQSILGSGDIPVSSGSGDGGDMLKSIYDPSGKNANAFDYNNLDNKPSLFDGSWSSLSGKPSTFTPSAHNHSATEITSGTVAIGRLPTGTSGSTVALGNHTHTFASITSKPTTIGGYGITDFNSLGDARWKPLSYVPAWADVTGKPAFAAVATTGSYSDLSNRPSIPDVSGKVNYTDTAAMLSPYSRAKMLPILPGGPGTFLSTQSNGELSWDWVPNNEGPIGSRFSTIEGEIVGANGRIDGVGFRITGEVETINTRIDNEVYSLNSRIDNLDVSAEDTVRTNAPLRVVFNPATNEQTLSIDTASAAKDGVLLKEDFKKLTEGRINAVVNSTTNKTLALAEAGALIAQSSSSSTTITVPADASVAFPVGTQISISRMGTGSVSISAAGGVTVGSADGKTSLRVQYSTASLVKTAANTWLLIGDLN